MNNVGLVQKRIWFCWRTLHWAQWGVVTRRRVCLRSLVQTNRRPSGRIWKFMWIRDGQAWVGDFHIKETVTYKTHNNLAKTYLTTTINPSNTFCPLLRYIARPSPNSFMIISMQKMDTKIILVVSKAIVKLSGCKGKFSKLFFNKCIVPFYCS